jgi:hypothetical protein
MNIFHRNSRKASRVHARKDVSIIGPVFFCMCNIETPLLYGTSLPSNIASPSLFVSTLILHCVALANRTRPSMFVSTPILHCVALDGQFVWLSLCVVVFFCAATGG